MLNGGMARGSRKYNVIGKFSLWEAEVVKDGADFNRFFSAGEQDGYSVSAVFYMY